MRFNSLNDQLREADSTIASLREEILFSTHANDISAKDIQQLQLDIQRSSEDKEAVTALLKTSNDKLEQVEKELKETLHENLQMMQEIASLKNTNENLQENFSKFQSRDNQNKEQIENLSRKVHNSEGELKENLELTGVQTIDDKKFASNEACKLLEEALRALACEKVVNDLILELSHSSEATPKSSLAQTLGKKLNQTESELLTTSENLRVAQRQIVTLNIDLERTPQELQQCTAKI